MPRLSDIVREHHKASSVPGSAGIDGAFRASSGPEPATTASSVSPPDLDWYHLAKEELLRLGHAVRQGATVRIEDIAHVATGITASVQQADDLLLKVFSCSEDRPLTTNPVHVAILAAKIGIGLGYEAIDLERLVLAGLLHDVGMFALPESLVMKPGALTPEERAQIEEHPKLGREILNRLGTSFGWLARVAWQEHERWDGQGYPDRLSGGQIHEYAQLIGLVDAFDALISPRSYRRRILPHHAVRQMLVNEKRKFPHHLLKALVEQLSVYPLGTVVRLNTGEVGAVIQVSQRYPLRPILQVQQSAEADGATLTKILDLSKTTLVHIVEVLKPLEAI
ncbi:MAG: HD-GYP domain-containing protein [Nitrospirota bacterium]